GVRFGRAATAATIKLGSTRQRYLHRASQRIADRHRGPRQGAEDSVVFRQEPGGNLPESGQQGTILLAAAPFSSFIATSRYLGVWRGRLRRGTGRNGGRLDCQRFAGARLGLGARSLIRFLIAARL